MALSDLHCDLNGFHFQDPGKLDAAAPRSAPQFHLKDRDLNYHLLGIAHHRLSVSPVVTLAL